MQQLARQRLPLPPQLRWVTKDKNKRYLVPFVDATRKPSKKGIPDWGSLFLWTSLDYGIFRVGGALGALGKSVAMRKPTSGDDENWPMVTRVATK